MTYHVISQEPDEEMLQYHDLLQQMLAGITHIDYECYYFSYGPGEPHTHWTVLDSIVYTKPVVIWLAIDSFSGANEFDWYVDTAPEGLIGFAPPSAHDIQAKNSCCLQKISICNRWSKCPIST